MGCWSASVRLIAKLPGGWIRTAHRWARPRARRGAAWPRTPQSPPPRWSPTSAEAPQDLGVLPRADFVQPPGHAQDAASSQVQQHADAQHHRRQGVGSGWMRLFSPSKSAHWSLPACRTGGARPVKPQMKTMVHPANSPGRSNGSKIRRNRAQRPAEQLCRFFQGGIDIGSRRRGGSKTRSDTGEGHQNHGRPSSIGQQIKRLVEDAPILKQNAQAAGSAKNMAKPDGTHKGGQDQWHQQEGDSRPCPGYLVRAPRPKGVRSPRQPSDRNGDPGRLFTSPAQQGS